MIRLGKVSSVNYAAGTVKVAFEDSLNVVSKAMAMLATEYKMPKVGERVACLVVDDQSNNGICIGPIFSLANQPSSTGKDTYHKELTPGVSISSSNGVLSFTGDVEIDGDLQVNGNLTVTGTINGG